LLGPGGEKSLVLCFQDGTETLQHVIQHWPGVKLHWPQLNFACSQFGHIQQIIDQPIQATSTPAQHTNLIQLSRRKSDLPP
jgi:hypothetical protein